VKLYREITSEEALQRYTGYILATPELGLRLLDNPDLYHRSVSGNKHIYATLPSQGHYISIALPLLDHNNINYERQQPK